MKRASRFMFAATTRIRRLWRQLFGIGLIAAATVMFLFLPFTESNARVVASGGDDKVKWEFIEASGAVNSRHALVIILSAAIGIWCLAWPSRKPPKLSK
jgi:hypothetical protein